MLVVHDHGHPHILVLQIANAFSRLYVASRIFPCPQERQGRRGGYSTWARRASRGTTSTSSTAFWATMP
ncbi:hypothetical protein BD413DRAFT_675113, partial [Trametes elegans]